MTTERGINRSGARGRRPGSPLRILPTKFPRDCEDGVRVAWLPRWPQGPDEFTVEDAVDSVGEVSAHFELLTAPVGCFAVRKPRRRDGRRGYRWRVRHYIRERGGEGTVFPLWATLVKYRGRLPAPERLRSSVHRSSVRERERRIR